MSVISVIFLLVLTILLAVCFRATFVLFISIKRRKKIILAIGNDLDNNKFKTLLFACERLLSNVCAPLLKLNFISNGVNNIVILLTLKGKKATASQVLCALSLFSLIAFIIAFVLSFSPVFAISILLVCFIGCLTLSNSRLSHASNEIREQVPDAIQCMTNCANAGFSLQQTFEQVQKESTGALAMTFRLASQRLKLTGSVNEALQIFESAEAIPELKFIAIAFRVQHISGGPISEVLECSRESVLSELELARTLRVQTTQAKMSATIVTLMPFVLLALFSFMSPGFLSPFFSSFLGMAIFVLAFIMQLSGVLLVRKTLAKCES